MGRSGRVAKPGRTKPRLSASQGEGSPSEGESRPSTEGRSPSEGEGRPSTEGRSPSEGEGRPSTEGRSPSEGEGRPSTEGRSPSEGEGRPSTNECSPSEGESLPSTDGRSPFVRPGSPPDEGHWPVGGLQLATHPPHPSRSPPRSTVSVPLTRKNQVTVSEVIRLCLHEARTSRRTDAAAVVLARPCVFIVYVGYPRDYRVGAPNPYPETADRGDPRGARHRAPCDRGARVRRGPVGVVPPQARSGARARSGRRSGSQGARAPRPRGQRPAAGADAVDGWAGPRAVIARRAA